MLDLQTVLNTARSQAVTKNKEVEEIYEKLKTGELDPEEAVKLNLQRLQTTKRLYIPPTTEDIRGEYRSDLEIWRKGRDSQIPFISEEATSFRLSQGLVLLGGISGQGKSSVAANIIAGFLKFKPELKALMVTNEESTASVYDRIACILLRSNFLAYYNRELDLETEQRIQEQSELLGNSVIVEGGSRAYDMTCLEDVQAVLVHMSEGGYGLCLLDYLQTVTWSRERPDLEPMQVSKRLGDFFKRFSSKVPMPLCVFVQLRSKGAENNDFKSRVENDRTIFNHAFAAVEIIPDFETGITKFVTVKDRFQTAREETEVEMKFIGGRFEPLVRGL